MRFKLGLGGLATLCLLAVGTVGSIVIGDVSVVVAKPASPAIAQTMGQLTEANIRQTINALQAALNKENLEELFKHIAPFASTEITIEGEDESHTITIDGKEQLRAVVKELFASIKNREILSQNISIRLSDDNNVGIATVYTTKSITAEDGKKYIYSDLDILRFAWLNNQPTLISSKSRGWVAETTKSK